MGVNSNPLNAQTNNPSTTRNLMHATSQVFTLRDLVQDLRALGLLLAAAAWLSLSMLSHGAEPPGGGSLKMIKAKADRGDAASQYLLGRLYEFGIGIGQDAAKAAFWYGKAADQNLAKAQYGLGRLYAEGEGVNRDLARAVDWYRKAAAQDYPLAKNKLGRMYATGQGVPQSDVEAYRWFTLAARHPDAVYAVINRETLAKQLDAEQIVWGELLASESLADAGKTAVKN